MAFRESIPKLGAGIEAVQCGTDAGQKVHIQAANAAKEVALSGVVCLRTSESLERLTWLNDFQKNEVEKTTEQ